MRRIAYYLVTVAFGGAELHTLELLQGLDRSVFEPVLYFRGLDPASEARMRREIAALRVPIRPLDDEGLPLAVPGGLRSAPASSVAAAPAPSASAQAKRLTPFRTATRALRQAWYYWRCAWALARVFRADRLDVIQFEPTQHPSLELPLLGSRLARIPVRVMNVTSEPTSIRDRRLIHKLLAWLAARSATHVRAMHPAMEEQLRGRFGISHRRIHVIANGIDVDPFLSSNGADGVRSELGIPPHSRVVTVPARLSPEKGHAVLLEAITRLHPRHPEAHYVFVGDGPLGEELRARAAQQGLGGHVHFLGFRTDMPRLLQASDLVVLPSFTEGMPRVLLEAMAAAKPIVATDVGGVGELFRAGRIGHLVRPGDATALEQAMEELLSCDETRRRRCGAEGRAVVQRQYTMRQMIQGFLGLYEEAMRS